MFAKETTIDAESRAILHKMELLSMSWAFPEKSDVWDEAFRKRPILHTHQETNAYYLNRIGEHN